MASISVLKQSIKSGSSFAEAHGQQLAGQCLRELAEQRDTIDEELDPADEISETRIAGLLLAEYLVSARESGNVFVEHAFLAVVAARLGAGLDLEIRGRS